jgi:hypothetical protein
MSVPGSWIVFWPYVFLILAGLLIPSDGQHGFFSIKSLAFIFTFASLFFYSMIHRHLTIYQVKLFVFAFFSFTFLAGWLLIGLLYEKSLEHSQIDQFKIFVITISFPLITLYLIKEKIISPSLFLKIVIFANFSYGVFKIGLVILHLLNLIDMWQLMHAAGIRFMRMSITGTLERVQTSVDIVTPFLVFFLLEANTFGVNFNKKFKFFYLGIALLSTLLSFSRYLIFIYFCSLLLHSLNLTLYQFLKCLFGTLCLLLASYFAIGSENIEAMVERRLTSIENFNSDSIRVQQIQALLTEYEKVPFFGKGLGGYSSQYIRDSLLLHHYEVQWFAFLMQFGLMGILWLFIPLGMVSYRFCVPPLSLKKISFFILFLLWILSGFTNPFLISLASGIVYALFLVSSLKFKPS